MKTIKRVTRNQIRETNHFKKLNKVQQDVTMNRNNVEHLKHGVEVSSNIGFEKWEQQSNFNWNNVQIVKELTSN